MKCGCCGGELHSHGICQVDGCMNNAEYEGWVECRDPLGCPTGSMRLVKVCFDHKCVLIHKGEIDVKI